MEKCLEILKVLMSVNKENNLAIFEAKNETK